MSGYKDLLVGAKPSQEGTRRVVVVSDQVVDIANKATGQLVAFSGSTQAIKDELELGRLQWIFFDNALNGRESEKKTSTQNVATTSERILEVMDNVVSMYEKLSR